MAKAQRPTVSFLVRTKATSGLLIKFRTKRNGGFGIPGGGKEIGDSVQDTLLAECKQELGLNLSFDEFVLFAIRDNPVRDILPGKKLGKYVLGLPDEIAATEVEAHHNLDFLFVTREPISGIEPSKLTPSDPGEVEYVFEADLLSLPDNLPISDDRSALLMIGRHYAGAEIRVSPVFMS